MESNLNVNNNEMMSEESNKISDYIVGFYKIYETTIDMLEARGYKNLDRPNILNLLQRQLEYYQDNQELKRSIFSLDLNEEGGLPHILVYFLDEAENSIGLSSLEEPLRLISQNNINDVILITPQDLTSQATAGLNELKTKNIVIFHDYELTFNILKHRLSPTYQLLSFSETKTFFQENKSNIKPNQMPKIYEKDPAIKFLGGRAGQVVRIIRNNYSKNLLVPSTISYRLIIEGFMPINTKK